jgi:hypothetical protein
VREELAKSGLLLSSTDNLCASKRRLLHPTEMHRIISVTAPSNGISRPSQSLCTRHAKYRRPGPDLCFGMLRLGNVDVDAEPDVDVDIDVETETELEVVCDADADGKVWQESELREGI